MFGNDIVEVFCVSNFFLNKEREDSIRDSFKDQKVHFSYPQDLNDFNNLIENFMQVKADYIDNDMGELPVINRLIILDHVSGLADKSEQFSNFYQKIWLPENMVSPASMFSIPSILVDRVGK